MPGGMDRGRQWEGYRFTLGPMQHAPANEVVVENTRLKTPRVAGLLSLDENIEAGRATVGMVYVHPQERGRGLAPLMWHAAGGDYGHIDHDVEHLTPHGARFANKVSPGGDPRTGRPFEPSIPSLIESAGMRQGHNAVAGFIKTQPGSINWQPGRPVPRGMHDLHHGGRHLDEDYAMDVPDLDDPLYFGAEVVRHPRRHRP